MLIDLLQSGMTAKELTEEYKINSEIIKRWKRYFKTKLGDFSKKRKLSEELELKLLKKELRDVKMESDILKRAVSIFSKSDQGNITSI